jgi:hypothetical protein
MKFRINTKAKSNAGKLVEVERNVFQWPNGRVEIVGIINGRQAYWSGSLGTDVTPANAETQAWLEAQTFDRAAYTKWLDEQLKAREIEDMNRRVEIARRQAQQAKELRIIEKARQRYAAAVNLGEMQFDGLPQIANDSVRGGYWVQTWVYVTD